MLARVFGTFWGNSYIFFVRQFCFPTEQVKKLLQWLNKHWNTTCSQYVHAGCVKHVRNTTELSKASSHIIKSNKPGEIGRLARLVTIQKLLHDPKPLGAQTRGKYSKENQNDKTLGHMWLSSLAVCVLFVVFVGICWWGTGSGSERIPAIYQSYLLKLSPCMWYVKSNRTVELGLLITTYSVGALKSHFICVCGDCEFNLTKNNKIQKRVGLTVSLLSNTWTADGLHQYLYTFGVHMDENPRITWN